LEILPTEGAVWCEAPESANQSLTELWGGCSTMVLTEFASDCTVPGCPARRRSKRGLLVQLLLPGDKARWGVRSHRGHEGLRPLLTGGRQVEVHGDVPLRRVHVRRPWGGPRPSLVVAAWETTVVLQEVLPPRFPPLLLFLLPLPPLRRLLFLFQLVSLPLFLPGGRGGAKGGGADNVVLE
jgi:hypothetical protein